jgi:accessory gene regulator B
MMKNISLNIARNIGNILESQQNVEIYAYALELLFMVILNLILVILVAFYLQIIPTTLVFLVVFILFRGFGGGVHLSTFLRCIAVGSSLMLGSAYLAATVSIKSYTLAILFVVALLFVLVCTIKWVPAITEKKSVNRCQSVNRQKRNMLITTFIWTSGVAAVICCQFNTLALAMILGAIVSTVLISPVGFGLMDFIDRTLNNLGKGGINS